MRKGVRVCTSRFSCTKINFQTFGKQGVVMEEYEGNLFKELIDEKKTPLLSLKARKYFDFENKNLLFQYHMRTMLIKENQIFEWKGLPDSIPKRVLELQLATHGYTIFIKFEGKLYALYGALGGRFDYNYMPTKAIISNPYLKLDRHEFRINEDCVVIPNDTMYLGLVPLNRYYATQLVENDQSLNCVLINARLTDLLKANDEDSKKSLEDLVKARKDGKISVAYDKNFFSDDNGNIIAMPIGERASNTIVQLIEHKQYIKGSFYNEIGIQSNYNMKRETITSNENILNVDSLLPLIDDMKEKREIGIKQLNEVFGDLAKGISVDFSSSWKKLRDEIAIKENIEEDKEINDKNSKHLEKEGETDENKD